MRDTCFVEKIRDWKGKRLIGMSQHDGLFQVPPDKPVEQVMKDHARTKITLRAG